MTLIVENLEIFTVHCHELEVAENIKFQSHIWAYILSLPHRSYVTFDREFIYPVSFFPWHERE